MFTVLTIVKISITVHRCGTSLFKNPKASDRAMTNDVVTRILKKFGTLWVK